MNNIEVVLHGTDSLIIRSNGYSDVWNMMRLLNSNQLVSLSDVLVSVGLRPNDMKYFKIVAFNNTSENNGFSYKFIFPEFMPVVLPDIKVKEDSI